MVHHPLGAGEYRVVIGDGHAARGLVAELRGVHRADAGHQAIRRALFDQFFQRAASALGGQGQGAVFDEAAGIQQVVEVLAGGALAGLAPPGDRLRAARIRGDGVAFERFGEVGADMFEIEAFLGLHGIAGHLGGLQEQQGRAFEQAAARRHGQRADDAALAGLDHELHLHRLQHGHRLASGHGIAHLHVQAHQYALARRMQRHAAGRRLDLAGPGRAGVGRGGEEQVRMGRLLRCQQLADLPFDEAGVHTVREFRPAQQVLQEVDIARHPLQAEFAEGAVGAAQGGGKVFALDDQLGQQRVVAGAGLVARVAVTVDADACAAGWFIGADHSTGRAGAAIGLHAFQVDPQLHGEAARSHRFQQAKVGQAGAARQAQLRLHQVDAGDGLGDAVLDLDARVGLHEHEVATGDVHQEFEGAEAAVADGGGQGQRGVEDALAQAGVQVGCRGDLEHLLVPPLQAAVALPEVGHPLAVAQHLDFDMPGILDQAFDIELAAAEGRARLGLAALEGLFQLRRFAHRAHAAPAAAGQGLEHDRAAFQQGASLVQAAGAVAAVGQRQAATGRQLAGAGLVAEQIQGLGSGADETDAGRLALAGEAGVLAEEAIAGVHRVAAVRAGDLHQLRAVQVGRRAASRERHRKVGLAQVQGVGVVLGEHRDTADPQLGGGAGDADGDLATVGDQQLGDGAVHGGGPCGERNGQS
ncbi:hypothetical protein FQZ97_655290 [compost metagenome]